MATISQQTVSPTAEEELWLTAQKRAKFKEHVVVYIVVIILLWLIWLIKRLAAGELVITGISDLLVWPMFATIGWGIGIIFDYVDTYYGNNKNNLTEKEYHKLRGRMSSP